jgi:hypothetical protein
MKTRIATTCLLAYSVGSAATTMTYKGQLQHGGQLYSEPVDLVFELYDSDENGMLIAGPLLEEGVDVSDGLFQVDLDFGAGAIDATQTDSDQVQLRISGNCDPGTTLVGVNPDVCVACAALPIGLTHLADSDGDVGRYTSIAIATQLAAANNSVLSNMIGSAVARRLATGTRLAEQMLTLRARYVFLAEQYFDMDPDQLLDYPLTRLEQDTIEHGEFEAMARRAEYFGLPSSPPPGWQPRDRQALQLPEDRG